MGSGGGEDAEGRTLYETTSIEAGGEVLRGSFDRDGTRKGTFRLARSGAVHSVSEGGEKSRGAGKELKRAEFIGDARARPRRSLPGGRSEAEWREAVGSSRAKEERLALRAAIEEGLRTQVLTEEDVRSHDTLLTNLAVELERLFVDEKKSLADLRKMMVKGEVLAEAAFEARAGAGAGRGAARPRPPRRALEPAPRRTTRAPARARAARRAGRASCASSSRGFARDPTRALLVAERRRRCSASCCLARAPRRPLRRERARRDRGALRPRRRPAPRRGRALAAAALVWLARAGAGRVEVHVDRDNIEGALLAMRSASRRDGRPRTRSVISLGHVLRRTSAEPARAELNEPLVERPRPRSSRCSRRSAAGSTSRRGSSRSRRRPRRRRTASTRRSASPPRRARRCTSRACIAPARHLARRRLHLRRRPGRQSLRERWREKQLAENPSQRGKAVGLPIVTSALTHGLAIVGDLFVEAGDVILLPDKLWGNYRLTYEVRLGAQIVTFPFYARAGFDTAGFGAALAQQARGPREGDRAPQLPEQPDRLHADGGGGRTRSSRRSSRRPSAARRSSRSSTTPTSASSTTSAARR